MCRAAILVRTVTVPAKDWASQPGRKRNEEQATHERCCRRHEKQVFFVIRGEWSLDRELTAESFTKNP